MKIQIIEELLAEVYFDIATGNDYLDADMLKKAREELSRLRKIEQAAQVLGFTVYNLFEALNADDFLYIGDWEQALRKAYEELNEAGAPVLEDGSKD